ncbi:MAG: PQQ-binding-like beta-propeller repeat protein [Planctomycetota bacterium]|nr:PQQ-binding-like beta-propeller repeat protein [Planctomycetota bacterium]
MIRLTTASLLLCSLPVAQSESWPRFRGPANTDHSPDTGLLKSWPKGGPKRLWLHEKAGMGYSGFSVLGNRLFTMGTRSGSTILLCLDAATGKKVWSTKVGKIYKNDWGDGPRSTPTIDGDLVYAIGGQGDILCVRHKNGKKVWSRAMNKFGGKTPYWGYSESILIDGDQAVCAPGGSKGALVALNKKTGKTIWQSQGLSGKAEYSSVVAAEINGTRQYIRLLQKTVAGVDASSGKVLWTYEWPGRTAVIPTPIVDGNKIYITSGYNAGCMLIEVGADEVKLLWQNKVMQNHHGGVVRIGDYLYGHANTGWVCQSWEDGSSVWRERKALKKGAVHYADGMLYCLEERSGVVALVEATSEGFKEASRFTLSPQAKNRARRGAIWVHPVVLDGRLFLRDQEYIYCYDVKTKVQKNN